MSPIGCSLEREQRESEAVLLTPQQPHVHVVVLVSVTVTHAHHKKHGKCGSTKIDRVDPQEAFAMILVSALHGLFPVLSMCRCHVCLCRAHLEHTYYTHEHVGCAF